MTNLAPAEPHNYGFELHLNCWLWAWQATLGLIYHVNVYPNVYSVWVNSLIFSNFQSLCGTDPFPELYRAKKYKLNDHFFTKKDFTHIMLNLPVQVTYFIGAFAIARQM